MAKAAKRKLKVFQAQLGFYDTVVAAPSRPKALRAWGVRQDLFAGGQARETDDAAAIASALAHPEVPLRRAVGSNDPFELDPTGLPDIPDLPKRQTVQRPQTKSPTPKPARDRTALDAAEAALAKLETARTREEADLQRRQNALDAARADAQAAYVAARKTAAAAVAKARKAYGEGKDEL